LHTLICLLILCGFWWHKDFCILGNMRGVVWDDGVLGKCGNVCPRGWWDGEFGGVGWGFGIWFGGVSFAEGSSLMVHFVSFSLLCCLVLLVLPWGLMLGGNLS